MAGVQGSALAAAVSNAGGLGSLPAAMLAPDALRKEVAALAALTSKPFNVNFFCHTPPVVDAARESAVAPGAGALLWGAGLSIDAIPSGPGRTPFDQVAADVLDECRPCGGQFSFWIAPAGAPGSGSSVGIEGARVGNHHRGGALAGGRGGVDAIIAQGLEAGGHRGHFLSHDLTMQMGTFALLPQMVRAVQTPVIAAGGIATAAGVAAAKALGAVGVQVGTAYLLCPEATTSAVHRAVLKSDRARHYVIDESVLGAAGTRDRESADDRTRRPQRTAAGLSIGQRSAGAAAKEGGRAWQR